MNKVNIIQIDYVIHVNNKNQVYLIKNYNHFIYLNNHYHK